MAMVIDPNLNYDYEIMCTPTQHVLMPKIWPENMMETIEAIVKLLSRCPKSPLFKFEMNGEAAESNFHVLRKFNFDLEKALVAQVGSPVVYRSEFSKGELPWLGKSPTCRRHVGPTAKSRHFWTTLPSRADTNSFPTLFCVSGIADFLQGTYGVIIVQTGKYYNMY